MAKTKIIAFFFSGKKKRIYKIFRLQRRPLHLRNQSGNIIGTVGGGRSWGGEVREKKKSLATIPGPVQVPLGGEGEEEELGNDPGPGGGAR